MNAVKIGMTIEEAAECTGIGRNTMRKLVDWGKLPVLKVGRKTIIRRDTLERFMTVNQGRNLLNQNTLPSSTAFHVYIQLFSALRVTDCCSCPSLRTSTETLTGRSWPPSLQAFTAL